MVVTDWCRLVSRTSWSSTLAIARARAPTASINNSLITLPLRPHAPSKGQIDENRLLKQQQQPQIMKESSSEEITFFFNHLPMFLCKWKIKRQIETPQLLQVFTVVFCRFRITLSFVVSEFILRLQKQSVGWRYMTVTNLSSLQSRWIEEALDYLKRDCYYDVLGWRWWHSLWSKRMFLTHSSSLYNRGG